MYFCSRKFRNRRGLRPLETLLTHDGILPYVCGAAGFSTGTATITQIRWGIAWVVVAPWNFVMGDLSNASLTPAIKLTGLVVAVRQKKTVICRGVPSPRPWQPVRVLLGLGGFCGNETTPHR